MHPSHQKDSEEESELLDVLTSTHELNEFVLFSLITD